MIRRVVALSLALSLLGVAPARGEVAPPTAAELAERVAALASPDMEGRRSGTLGGERAARLIADWLATARLRPGGDRSTFFQSLVVESGTRLAARNALELIGGARRSFETGREWMAHGGSMANEISGEIVFAGYGVVAPDERYDDYAGVDARGKIVLALDGTPVHLAGHRHSRLDKVLAARGHGAGALLLAGDALPPLDATAVPVDLISAALTRRAADTLLAPSGRTTEGLARAIADSRAPVSFATGVRARVQVDLEREDRRAANVVGVLPGTDSTLADEAVVIGAHYDHLGRVNGVVHPGADDNASGAALVVGLARAFAAEGRPGRTLVFALFAAEELGMLGSTRYVRQPPAALARTIAMLNFDMVGRLRGDQVHVGGVDSGSGLRALVTEAAQAARLAPTIRGTPYAPSDHYPFYAAGVPVLFVTTGSHGDFHRPTDTPDKIDAVGMERIAAMAARIVERLADAPRPVYAKAPEPEPGRPSGGGVLFGIAADGRAPADGLWVARVLPDSPAERAGVREGDVIVRFAGVPVDSLEELRTVLRRAHPGDTVRVVYLRRGTEHATSATLEARP